MYLPSISQRASGLPAGFCFSKLIATALLCIATVMAHASPALAQDDWMPSHDVVSRVDSGMHYNNGDEPEVVWSETVQAEGAEWIRLKFSHLVLAYDEVAGASSTIKITSLKDGATQYLNGVSARQWYNSSAYFNGDAVRIELIAFPNGRLNLVRVGHVTVGEIPTDYQDSICGNTDDRQLSNDPRVGRTIPGGCTAWLFNDRKHCMLTAGHCAPSTDVIAFNVPLSNSNGSYNFPPPEDQYSVDQTSMQGVDGGVGNDWAYFGCFPNSNTGLTAFEAQGDSFELVNPPSVGGQIRITGHGTTSSPVNPAWNGAQKTHVGSFVSNSGTALGYTADTTGGNSGSPVIFEGDGTAIGIHTHGGCSSGGGNNSGTGANHTAFQSALANPQGICQAGLDFTFPNGRPSLLEPAGGTTMRVVVSDAGETPQPGTGMLHYDDGSGFQSVSMTQVSNNVYDAVFPAINCATVVRYYVSAMSTDGTESTNPSAAPASTFGVLSATDLQVAFADDFQANTGWSVSSSATDGQWQRGVPAGGGDRGDPPTDADGSGQCYVTDNADGNSDVDGGDTVLTSPVMDGSVSGSDVAVLSYYRWYSNNTGTSQDDVFRVEISNNAGVSWQSVETVGPTGPEVGGGWFLKSFVISDFVTPTDTMRVRFIASDTGAGSIVEAGVDGVKIEILSCVTTVEVVPATIIVDAGQYVDGGVADLADSDNSHLLVRKNPLSVGGGIIVEMSSTAHTFAPTAIDLRYEGSVLARRVVAQHLEVYNFDTDQWEVVDTRDASRTGDIVVDVSLTGDLSRFVQPGSMSIEARLRLETAFPRQLFVARMDQLLWTITN